MYQNFFIYSAAYFYRETRVPRRRFSSENVNISLTTSQSTAHLNISNIQTFTIWCERFAVFFTRLDLPTDVNIPPVVSHTECTQTHTHRHTHTHTHTHRHTHRHRHTHTHTQTHTHTHTHTHTLGVSGQVLFSYNILNFVDKIFVDC